MKKSWPSLLGHGARDEVHGRGADEARHELVLRVGVDLQRGADLLDEAVLHDHDPVAHGHGLDLVVGHVDHGGLQPVVELLQLGAHGHAQLGVQVGERLVEEEDLRLAHDGAADGHALALTAGQGAGLALQELLDAQEHRRLLDALLDLRLGELAQLQTERHVVVDGHVRIEGVVLEDHGDVPVFGRDVVDHPVADLDGPLGNLFQAGDHPEGGGLPAPGRPDQDDELLVVDGETHVADRHHRVELFPDVFQVDLCHGFPAPPLPPAPLAGCLASPTRVDVPAHCLGP